MFKSWKNDLILEGADLVKRIYEGCFMFGQVFEQFDFHHKETEKSSFYFTVKLF